MFFIQSVCGAFRVINHIAGGSESRALVDNIETLKEDFFYWRQGGYRGSNPLLGKTATELIKWHEETVASLSEAEKTRLETLNSTVAEYLVSDEAITYGKRKKLNVASDLAEIFGSYKNNSLFEHQLIWGLSDALHAEPSLAKEDAVSLFYTEAL